MADRTVKVVITGDSSSAEAAFRRLKASAEESGVTVDKFSGRTIAAGSRTKELGSVAEETGKKFKGELKSGLEDITGTLTSRLGPAAGVAQTALGTMGEKALGAGAGLKIAAGAAVVGGVAIMELGKYAMDGVGKYTELTGSIRAFQRVSGASAEDASALVYTMHELGINADTASAAMFKMTRADPGKLHDLGVEIQHNADGSQNLTGTLGKVAEAYQKTTDPVQRNLILFTAFGKAGAAMGPLMAQSTASLAKFREEAEKHHAIFTQDDLNKARDYTLATREMDAAMEGLQLQLARAVIPTLTGVTHSLTGAVDAMDKANKGLKEHHTSVIGLTTMALMPGQLVHKAWNETVGASAQHHKDAAKAADEQAQNLRMLTAEAKANEGGIMAMGTANVAQFRAMVEAKVADKTATAEMTEAVKRLTTEEAALNKAIDGFIDPIKAYTNLTKQQATADEMAAKAAGLSKDQQKWSQDDWLAHTHVTTAQYLADLQKQVDDQTNWSNNLQALAGRASAGTLKYLAELGPQGAPLVAQLVNSSDAEMTRMNALMDQKSATATAAVAANLQNAKPMWDDIMAASGQSAVDALTEKFRSGQLTLAQIMDGYRAGMATGVNPILAALGMPQISYAQAAAGWGNQGLRDGGWVEGGTGPRADDVPLWGSGGEFMVNAVAASKHGPMLEHINAAKYADGGWVTGGDVPHPPSTAPFNLPISTGADAAMSHEYDVVKKWVDDNSGGGKKEIKDWIQSVAGSPYIWGGGGPVGWDCSGYTGSVYLAMMGQPFGQGQRAFTTLSDFHALGFEDGPGGVYTIGVSPTHMVGRYGGLPFEAGSTPIKAGPGAQDTARFPKQYHIGQGKGLGSGSGAGGDGSAAAAGGSDMKNYAQEQLTARGWGGQFGALDYIFSHESGWNPNDVNPSSGAYGIPQANPSGGQGHPYALGDWKAQIDWGLGYIGGRYGDPNGAERFWRANQWYENGGVLPPGATLAMNGTGANEYVLNQRQFANLAVAAAAGVNTGGGGTTVKQFNLGGVQVRDTAAAVMAEFHRLELLAG